MPGVGSPSVSDDPEALRLRHQAARAQRVVRGVVAIGDGGQALGHHGGQVGPIDGLVEGLADLRVGKAVGRLGEIGAELGIAAPSGPASEVGAGGGRVPRGLRGR